jgi:hypothetical protein
MSSIAVNLKRLGLACPTVILVLCVGCSSSMENRTKPQAPRAQSKPRFRNSGMDALYKAAKASPRSFGPVYAYAKTVTDVCLASLADERCQQCGEGALRYKRRSELEPHYWPIIEEALSMLDAVGKVAGLTAEEMDVLVATKGRLLWLAGRSVEEQPMIDEYAEAHPGAVAVIRRRLELLRESGDAVSLASQCAHSRAKTRSAPAAARVDLLTACVALNPKNIHGRSDLMDYAKYLPNLTTTEEFLYRKHLVDGCEAKTAEEEAQCAEGCACDDAGKRPTGKCKRACATCRNERSQRLRICKMITDAPSAVVRAPRPSPAPAASARRVKSTRSSDARRPKVDTGRGPKPMEL